MILLDTNVVSEPLKLSGDAGVMIWIPPCRVAFGRPVFVYLFNSELMLSRLKQKWQVVC